MNLQIDSNLRKDWIFDLDEKMLVGGLIIPETLTRLLLESDDCFINGNFLSSIILSVAVIETYFRSENAFNRNSTLFELIQKSDFSENDKGSLHKLRKYRNSWVHIKEPWEDSFFLNNIGKSELEIFEMAKKSMYMSRKILYSNQWI